MTIIYVKLLPTWSPLGKYTTKYYKANRKLIIIMILYTLYIYMDIYYIQYTGKDNNRTT